MTLRFYNGNNRFVLVDTEVHGCTDVVRRMRWGRPATPCGYYQLPSVNFIALTYLALLVCFLVVTPAAQGTIAPAVGGNATIETTEMFTVAYSMYTFLAGPPTTTSVVRDQAEGPNCPPATVNISLNDTSKICKLPPNCPFPMGETFCKWRTDFLEYCRDGSKNCTGCVERFVELDALSTKYFEQYNHVLSRYDCRADDIQYSYSIWNCEECRMAYKDWLCATQIPYYKVDDGTVTTIQPCGKFCERTESRCPYFLPQKPYCGQRTFFCSEPRETARSTKILNETATECFTCNFSLEDEFNATSVENLQCHPFLMNITEARSSSWSVHNSNSNSAWYSVILALTLYTLLMWGHTPMIIAGT